MFWSPNSQYIAYFREGILPPGNELPMELWIYNLQNHQQTFVVRHDELFHNVAWTPDNRLIYSLIPEPAAARKGVLAPLFIVAPGTNNRAKVLLLDAILPTPSPDGQWIAAFSQGKAGDPKLHALHQQRLLRIFSTGNGEMITVNNHADFNFSALIWSNDSRHLYRATKDFTHYSDKNQLIRVHVFDCDLASSKEKEIASLDYMVPPQKPGTGVCYPRA